MNDHKSRQARKQTSRVGRRARARRRASLALALAAVLGVLGAIPAAQASTGGASSYEAPIAADASGEEVAFGPTRYAGASWYGPGLWGRTTACGMVLRRTTIGVAHKRLPCGTTVRFAYHGHTVTAPVIDRGPYVRGRAWDLTYAAGQALGLEEAGVARVGYQIAIEYARR